MLQDQCDGGHLGVWMITRVLGGQGDDEQRLWVSRGERSHQKTAVSAKCMARNSLRRLARLRGKSTARGEAPGEKDVEEVIANSFLLHLCGGKQVHGRSEFQM